jgi:hypothetical protein
MRDNREKWQFYDHPSRPALPLSEVRYWKGILQKILKVGMEFEFNLKEQKGTCKGDNTQCPCVHINKNCWKGCSNTNMCREVPFIETCSARRETCDSENCQTCLDFKFSCLGIACIDFVSECFSCDRFAKSCEGCEKKYDMEKDPKVLRDKLTNDFKPTNNYGRMNESGVVAITTDGSLLGDKGAEIITIGRRVDYWEFYQMADRILKKMHSIGAFLNERTGSHMHVLASYYENEGSSELEKSVPQIIVANFHQLVRRYQNALTWLTIALDNPNHMTRWEKFRVSVLGVSPVLRDMRKVAEEIHKTSGNKYGFVNYDRMRFDGAGNTNRFHVEFREADSTMCPSYYAAIACLHYAFVIKSVEISRYGLLKVGNEEWLKKSINMKNVILNGVGDWSNNRVSDTSNLLDHRDFFIAEAKDMIDQLKNILISIGPAYDVLIKLAEQPVAMRRIEGKKWEEIEKDLAVVMTQHDHIDSKVRGCIDLRTIDQCVSIEEWVDEVHKILIEDEEIEVKLDKDQIHQYMSSKMRDGEIIWSEKSGCPLII